MYKYEDLIREFGNVAVANASFGEHSHIDFKAAKQFTNNHKGSLMSQVGRRAVEGWPPSVCQDKPAGGLLWDNPRCQLCSYAQGAWRLLSTVHSYACSFC